MTRRTRHLAVQYRMAQDTKWHLHQHILPQPRRLAKGRVCLNTARHWAKIKHIHCRYRLAWITITETHTRIK